MADSVPSSGICRVEDGLAFRGYPVAELAGRASYESVAYLLIHGDLPTAAELAGFRARVAMARRLPEPVRELFAALPRWTTPLDALRTAVSALAHFDQDASDDSPEAERRKAERLVAQLPVVVADYFRVSQGLQPVLARQELPHSANLLTQLRGRDASPAAVAALDAAMVVAAEYEFNPSAYAARVIVSTGADVHSAVTGAVGALRGSRAGSANERVVRTLDAAANAATVEGWAREQFAAGGVVGFGPAVAATGDARAGLLKAVSRTLAESAGPVFVRLENTADEIERVAVREYGLTPTVEWPVARLYHALGLDWSLYPPLFATARVAGWCAHALEQRESGELIRPRARYTGPADRAVPAGGVRPG